MSDKPCQSADLVTEPRRFAVLPYAIAIFVVTAYDTLRATLWRELLPFGYRQWSWQTVGATHGPPLQ